MLVIESGDHTLLGQFRVFCLEVVEELLYEIFSLVGEDETWGGCKKSKECEKI